MSTFDENLASAIKTCETGIWQHGEYSRMYAFTTENISGYVNLFDLQGKSLLTVGSSGDQVLNAFYQGARDITLYDINKYAEYYTYLKIAGIMSLTYREFRLFFLLHGDSIFYNRHMFNKEAFKRIKPALRLISYESFLFFDEIFSLFKPEEIRNRLFEDDESRTKVIYGFNNYLKDEASYNKMQSIIRGISFKYINGDIFKDEIPGQYDNVFLSNLSNVKPFGEFKNLLETIDNNHLKTGGSMQIAYLWDMYFDQTYYDKEWFEIYKLPVIKKELAHFLTEAHDVMGSRDILWKEKNKRDLVLIYRK